MASVETTLGTANGQIRQFAFDGDESTYFASQQSPGAEDHFTLVLNPPVSVKSITVTTGRADGANKIEAGTLEVSRDGKTFRELARFTGGIARGGPTAEPIRAIRVKPGSSTGMITIRELAIASDPPVPVFRYPVEFAVDTSDAPELKEWLEKAARTCERAYPMIVAELGDDGFRPPRQIALRLTQGYRGVAATARDHIFGSASYFKSHPGDVGALVHETVHVVQSYRRRKNPSWLVEGVSDYVALLQVRAGEAGADRPEDRPLRRQLPRDGGFPGLSRPEVRQGHRTKAQSRCVRAVTTKRYSSRPRASPCGNWTRSGGLPWLRKGDSQTTPGQTDRAIAAVAYNIIILQS